MQDISFGKFFDTQIDKEFIKAFEVVGYDDDSEYFYYLLKNTLDNNYYAVQNYGNGGGNWEVFYEWVEQQLQRKDYKLEEIEPKNSDWYADYSIFRVVFES